MGVSGVMEVGDGRGDLMIVSGLLNIGVADERIGVAS